MRMDEHETPVLFRVSQGEVTAVFPCEPSTYDGSTMSCYAHVGQHGQCSLEWYHTTRAAGPAEYESLKRELEAEPYGYRLKVCKRLTRKHRDAFWAEVRRYRASSGRAEA